MNQKDLAQWMGKSTKFVASLARRRVIPEVRLSGKARLYDIEKVRRALEKFETKAILTQKS